MGLSIKELSILSGVTVRTLHYYDEIGLLSPKRQAGNDYRIYTDAETDKLQQILFYRELGFKLMEIKNIISSPAYNKKQALKSHLSAVKKQRRRLDRLIKNIENTLEEINGGKKMDINEKFEGLKDAVIKANEEKYGKELRSKYGDETITASNKKIKEMSQEKWDRAKDLENEIKEQLLVACQKNSPNCSEAQKACELHAEWLKLHWKDDIYSKATHKAMGEMYVNDQRFKAYYENIAPNCTSLFKNALEIYCKE